MTTLAVDIPDKLVPLFSPARYKVAHGGRCSAKSWSFARALLVLGISRRMRILCAREVQRSIKDSVHKLLKDQIEELGIGSCYRVLETEIRGTNGTEFAFTGLSSQTIESLKSFEGCDVCWVEEGQVVSRRSWDILIPTIRKEGSEIWVSMNPELDTDETYIRFIKMPPDGSFVCEMNWRDNPWFNETMDLERQACQRRDPVGYENIWEGKCRASVEGAIYGAEVAAAQLAGRIRPVPYDMMHKVHTIWDLGWNDSMSIIMCQRVASELRVIDYIEDSHRTLEWYATELRDRRYNWGQDWLPHDGFHKEYRTGKSAAEILTALGRNVAAGTAAAPAIPKLGVEEGIRMARAVFPRIYFDADRCGRLIECLKRYRRAIPPGTNEPAAPVHDEYSHGADVFRYLSVVADLLTDMRPTRRAEIGAGYGVYA